MAEKATTENVPDIQDLIPGSETITAEQLAAEQLAAWKARGFPIYGFVSNEQLQQLALENMLLKQHNVALTEALMHASGIAKAPGGKD